MLILGLLGVHFDVALVFFAISSLFSDWLWPYCVTEQQWVENFNSKNACLLGTKNLLFLQKINFLVSIFFPNPNIFCHFEKIFSYQYFSIATQKLQNKQHWCKTEKLDKLELNEARVNMKIWINHENN